MSNTASDDAAAGAGCALVFVLLVFGCAISSGMSWYNEWSLERSHRAFAEKQLPELQSLMDEIEDEISHGNSRIRILRDELERMGVNPAQDPDLTRWEQAIHKHESQLTEARALRAEAYLTVKKFELCGESFEAQLAAKLDSTKRAVRSFQEVYKTTQRDLESPN